MNFKLYKLSSSQDLVVGLVSLQNIVPCLKTDYTVLVSVHVAEDPLDILTLDSG